jgi:hypothetical protein
MTVEIEITVDAVVKAIGMLVIRRVSVGISDVTTPEGCVITIVLSPVPFEPIIDNVSIPTVLTVAVPTVDVVICLLDKLLVMMIFAKIEFGQLGNSTSVAFVNIRTAPPKPGCAH